MIWITHLFLLLLLTDKAVAGWQNCSGLMLVTGVPHGRLCIFSMRTMTRVPLLRETRDTIRSFFDPTVVCDRLQAASENGNFSQGLSLDPTIVIDQGIRKQVLLGLLFAEYPEDEAMHMADVIIDQKIDEIKKRRHTDQQIAIQQKEKEKRREKKKKNKRR